LTHIDASESSKTNATPQKKVKKIATFDERRKSKSKKPATKEKSNTVLKQKEEVKAEILKPNEIVS
jgi:hypothetical protein